MALPVFFAVDGADLRGSTVIIVGATGEACVRGRLGPGGTIRGVPIRRLRLMDQDHPTCRSYCYLLIGLTVPRCPECGQEFAWSDYPAELQLAATPGRG